jgi:LCP family protein required for cell wall assembly
MSRKTRKKRKKVAAMITVIVILLALVFFVFSCDIDAGQNLEKENGENSQQSGNLGEQEEEEQEEEKPYERLNILLLGIDSPKNTGRTDTIMLLSLGQEAGDVAIVSIPRDTRVNIPGHGLEKINHAHVYGGPELTMQVVESFFDLPVHYFACVNFRGFITLVDILGGVEMNVPPAMAAEKERGFTKSGPQVLDGKQALEYVRFRHDSEGDLGRVRRQQELVLTLAKKTMQLSSIPKIPAILDTVGRNFSTDIPLTTMTILANKMLHVDLDQIKRGVIPGEGVRIDGLWYYRVNRLEMEQMLQELGVI